MDTIIVNVIVNKWADLPSSIEGIKQGYCRPKDPNIYTLTKGEFTHYILESDFYYSDDLESDYTSNLDEILLSNDSVEFWAKTDQPLKELANRLQDFENICESVISTLEENTNIFGLNINFLPTHLTDNFIFDFVKAWVKFYDESLLDVPCDLEQSYNHCEELVYKWRKMVELYGSVLEIEGLRKYLKEFK